MTETADRILVNGKIWAGLNEGFFEALAHQGRQGAGHRHARGDRGAGRRRHGDRGPGRQARHPGAERQPHAPAHVRLQHEAGGPAGARRRALGRGAAGPDQGGGADRPARRVDHRPRLRSRQAGGGAASPQAGAGCGGPREPRLHRARLRPRGRGLLEGAAAGRDRPQHPRSLRRRHRPGRGRADRLAGRDGARARAEGDPLGDRGRHRRGHRIRREGPADLRHHLLHGGRHRHSRRHGRDARLPEGPRRGSPAGPRRGRADGRPRPQRRRPVLRGGPGDRRRRRHVPHRRREDLPRRLGRRAHRADVRALRARDRGRPRQLRPAVPDGPSRPRTS